MTELVCIPIERLLSGDNINASIAEAFGPEGLGALTVSGVEGYIQARRELLGLTPQLANLPGSVLSQYEDAEGMYTTGWSHGKEALSGSKKDLLKGSFYANPLLDEPSDDASQAQQFPSYLRPNIWPREHLPELEPAFKRLGRIIVSVGRLLMQSCDRYVQELNPGIAPGSLTRIMDSSRNHKARLLHYFPSNSGGQADVDSSNDQDWCGWHTDHGSLTGLTPAMYIKDGSEVPNPDETSGLYIRDRSGAVVKAIVPPQHILYQVGEAMQVHSGNLLQATPHYVKAATSGEGSKGVSRNTFATFMQPDVLEPLEFPLGVTDKRCATGRWQPGISFGAFAEATVKSYYSTM